MRKMPFPRLPAAWTALLLGAALAVLLVGCAGGRDDQSLNAVRLRGYIVVGVDDAFPPMCFHKLSGGKIISYELNLNKRMVEEITPADELVGFDVDLARKAAEKLGLKVVFKPVAWDRVIESLEAGDIDMIWSGLSVTKEREGRIIFSRPYLDNRQVIVVRSGSAISSKGELKGKRVGIQLGSSSGSALHADRAIAMSIGTLKRYPDNQRAIRDLEEGRLDAVVVDEVAGRYNAALKPGVFTILADDFGREIYAVGFAKGAVSLRNAVDGALDEMKRDGSADTIAKKWFAAAIIKK